MRGALAIFLYVFFIVCALTFIFVGLFLLRPVVTTKQVVQNTLQSNFDHGNGEVTIDTLVKPLYVRATRANEVRNAVVYTDLGNMGVTVPSQSAVMANMFQVKEFTKVVSLQIFMDSFNRTNPILSRSVAVYDMDQRLLLIQGSVSSQDLIQAGFRTRFLQPSEYALLIPGKRYAIVSVYLPNDSFVVQPNVVQPTHEFEILSGVTVLGASELFLPNDTDFAPVTNTLLFASLQIQKDQTVNQVLFSVDLANGYATFPPKYAYNLNVESVSPTQVSIDPGLCISHMDDVNMVNPRRLIVSGVKSGVANGLDSGTALQANQWYAVYVLNASTKNLVACGLLSLNTHEPFVQPVGYDVFRRVGWARTDTNAQFISSFQTGHGAQRRTFYREPQRVFSHVFATDEIANQGFRIVSLELVVPSATSCVLRITSQNPNSSTLFMVLRPRFTTTQNLVNVTIPPGTTIQQATVLIPQQPLPHALETVVSQAFAIGSDVAIDIDLLSFTHDI